MKHTVARTPWAFSTWSSTPWAGPRTNSGMRSAGRGWDSSRAILSNAVFSASWAASSTANWPRSFSFMAPSSRETSTNVGASRAPRTLAATTADVSASRKAASLGPMAVRSATTCPRTSPASSTANSRWSGLSSVGYRRTPFFAFLCRASVISMMAFVSRTDCDTSAAVSVALKCGNVRCATFAAAAAAASSAACFSRSADRPATCFRASRPFCTAWIFAMFFTFMENARIRTNGFNRWLADNPARWKNLLPGYLD